MSKIIQQQTGKHFGQLKSQLQDEPECVETRVCIWQDDSFQQLETDFLNQVFPEKLNKKTMSKGTQFIFHFLSSSLYYWIELRENQKPESQKLGIKDTKFIAQLLKQKNVQNDIAFNRWGEFFNKKDWFQEKINQESKFKVPDGGQKVHEYNRHSKQFGEQHFEIIKYKGDNKELAEYKKRFEVLFLFYIDGVSYVWQEQEQWVYYVVYRVGNLTHSQQNPIIHNNKQKDQKRHFVGVLSKYDFRISSIKQRHRISQVLILPCYQKHGHGKQLIDLVYKQSLETVECFQITTQGPSFEFQCLRDYKEGQMLIKSNLVDMSKIRPIRSKQDIIQNRTSFLSSQTIRKIKKELKLPGHQIERLVNIFIYNFIIKNEKEQIKATFQQDLRQRIIYNRSVFKSRRKQPHITVYGQRTQMKEFMIQKEKEDFIRNQGQVEEILTETLDGYRRVITKLNKLSLL